MFVKINKQLLDKSLYKAGIKDKVEIEDVIKTVEEYLRKKYGQEILKQIQPLYIKNKIFFIRIESSLLAEELKKQEQEIIDYIFNKTEHQIKRLSFKT